MPDILDIADKADMIIDGYAFTRMNGHIHVLNLNSPSKTVVLSESGETGIMMVCLSQDLPGLKGLGTFAPLVNSSYLSQ